MSYKYKLVIWGGYVFMITDKTYYIRDLNVKHT